MQQRLGLFPASGWTILPCCCIGKSGFISPALATEGRLRRRTQSTEPNLSRRLFMVPLIVLKLCYHNWSVVKFNISTKMFLPAAWLYLWNDERLKPMLKKYVTKILPSHPLSSAIGTSSNFLLSSRVWYLFLTLFAPEFCVYKIWSSFFLWELYLTNFIF